MSKEIGGRSASLCLRRGNKEYVKLFGSHPRACYDLNTDDDPLPTRMLDTN